MNASKTINITNFPITYVLDEYHECKECDKITKIVQATFQVGGKRIDFCSEDCLKDYLNYLKERMGIKNDD